MLEWLHREGQTDQAIEKFWRVVLVSALDEELDHTDARYGVEVFWKAFLANHRGFEIGIPSVPLAELYDGCHQAILRRKGEVRTRAGVRALAVQDGRVAGIVLPDGAKVTGDYFVLAVPHDVIAALLRESLVQASPVLRGLSELRVSPITGVHFWLDRPVLSEPFVTLLDQTVQWIFNKTALYTSRHAKTGQGNAQAEQYLQLVISASYDLVPLSRQQIIELCWRELQHVFPAAREAQLVKATVVKETAATFSPAPGCDRLRPGVLSPFENLFFAGDWTSTGWPATMEGAVRSGYRAAEEITARLGSPHQFIKEDLPLEGLSTQSRNVRFLAK
jgi:zeta-carotene desaturase